MTATLSTHEAWQALPTSEWNAEAARHLLQRAGWSARPDDVERAVRDGLLATLERLFPADPPRFAKPRIVERFEQTTVQQQRDIARLTGDERLRAQRALQERARIGLQELSLKWLQFAAEPAHAAVAKWVLCLSDVYVVAGDKVRNPAWLHAHFDTLGQHGFGPAPALTKAVSRSPAMVQYLDLNQSQRRAPNENFARELFELFVLGEGNYTEADIKEAARAFTGYRSQPPSGAFRFVPTQHDNTEKTIFGATGKFSGDDVIELAYSQKAAGTFLPRELARFYLSDTPLSENLLAALGQTWRESGFELRTLLRTFFGSRLFFAPEYRGNLIKSPLQFYLGLVQDLQLDVAPLARLTLTPLRQMGQPPFFPPNVRGWVGGKNWINSATITARRQVVELLFTPLDDNALNGDELLEVVAARSNGKSRFTVNDEPLAALAQEDPAEAAARLVGRYVAGATRRETAESLARFIAAGNSAQRPQRVRRAAITLLQSPDYQLC